MRSALQFRQVCSPSPTKWSNRARFCCMALWSLLALSDQISLQPNVRFWGVRSTGQCNTACSLSAGVWKPKVFRGR